MNIANLFFNKQAAKPQAAAQTPQTNKQAFTDIYSSAQNDVGELNWVDEIFQKLYPDDNKGILG